MQHPGAATPTAAMTVDEFLAWAEEWPGRYELAEGIVYGTAPERAGRARGKARVHRALERGIAAAGLACEALADGMTVRVDGDTAYEPDALVTCGARVPDDAVKVPEPVIVVEVLSPGTKAIDAGAKLSGYFAVPGIRHYLMVDPRRRVVVHHRREGEEIATRILGAGPLRLDPPGLVLAVEDVFGEA